MSILCQLDSPNIDGIHSDSDFLNIAKALELIGMSSSSSLPEYDSAEGRALEELGAKHVLVTSGARSVTVQLEDEPAGPASSDYSQVYTSDPLPLVHISHPYDQQIQLVRTPPARHSVRATPNRSDESSRSRTSSASSYEPYPASGHTSRRGSHTARSVTPGGQSASGFREQVLSIRPRRSSVAELMPSPDTQRIDRPTDQRLSPVSPRSVDRLSPRRMSISANRTPTELNSTYYDDRRRGRSAEYRSSSRGGSRHRSRVRSRATSKSDTEHAASYRRSVNVTAAAAAPLTKAWLQTKRVTEALRSCWKSYRRDKMIKEYDKLDRRLSRALRSIPSRHAQDHWVASTIEKACRWAEQTGERTDILLTDREVNEHLNYWKSLKMEIESRQPQASSSTARQMPSRSRSSGRHRFRPARQRGSATGYAQPSWTRSRSARRGRSESRPRRPSRARSRRRDDHTIDTSGPAIRARIGGDDYYVEEAPSPT